MRIIIVNPAHVVPLLDGTRIGYATWVKASKGSIPREIHVTAKPQDRVAVDFAYSSGGVGSFHRKEKWLDDVDVRICPATGMLSGFTVDAKSFHQRVQDIIQCLKDSQQNDGPTQSNYKIVASILQRHAGDLFIPPQ